MSASLTNTFIANTYVKLLQVDNDSNVSGITNMPSFLLSNSGDNATLLNGLGVRQPALLIDHSTQGNGGGLFLRNASGCLGLQIEGTGNNSEWGLNVWEPYGVSSNLKMFLKSTGSLWVGWSELTPASPSPFPPQEWPYTSIPSDESKHKLYVAQGIKIYKAWPQSNAEGNSGGGFFYKTFYNVNSVTNPTTRSYITAFNSSSGGFNYYNKLYVRASNTTGHSQVLLVERDEDVFCSGIMNVDNADNTTPPKCQIKWIRMGNIVMFDGVVESPIQDFVFYAPIANGGNSNQGEIYNVTGQATLINGTQPSQLGAHLQKQSESQIGIYWGVNNFSLTGLGSPQGGNAVNITGGIWYVTGSYVL